MTKQMEHTMDTLLDYAASKKNTPRNEDADGAHTKDPPMGDTAHGSTTWIHCWTTQLPISWWSNEDASRAHTEDPPMDGSADESTTWIH
ncbi:uncharacterized protein LOC111114887 isoform X2 [Crassostrea virginica]